MDISMLNFPVVLYTITLFTSNVFALNEIVLLSISKDR